MEKVQNIKTEEIEFYGDKLLGGQDSEGNVWLAINKTCQALGFDKKDSANQVLKINKDETLKKLVLNFQYQVKSDNGTVQNREMTFLSEKAITLWLAKISITKNMREKYPELSEKIIKYQLECASVLHNHFMGSEDKKNEFYNDMLNVDINDLKENMVKLINCNNNNQIEISKLRENVTDLNNQIYDLNKHFIIYQNPSIRYDNLLLQFIAKVRGIGGSIKQNHGLFWESICNYIDMNMSDFLRLSGSNKKNYIINSIGIDIVDYFVTNVVTGKIIKNSSNNWINLNSYDHNKFNIEKNKILKHWTSEKKGTLHCCYCGEAILNPKENVNYNFEHYIPKSDKNTSDSMSNIGIACCDCNKEKSNTSYEEFIKVKKTHECFIKRKEIWDKKYLID